MREIKTIYLLTSKRRTKMFEVKNEVQGTGEVILR